MDPTQQNNGNPLQPVNQAPANPANHVAPYQDLSDDYMQGHSKPASLADKTFADVYTAEEEKWKSEQLAAGVALDDLHPEADTDLQAIRSLYKMEFTPYMLQHANAVNADLRGARVKLTEDQIKAIDNPDLRRLVDSGTPKEVDANGKEIDNPFENTVSLEAVLLLGSDSMIKQALTGMYYNDKTVFGNDQQTNKDIHERLEYLSKAVKEVGSDAKHDYEGLRQDSTVVADRKDNVMVTPAAALEGVAMHKDVIGKIRSKSTNVDDYKISFANQEPDVVAANTHPHMDALDAWTALSKVTDYNNAVDPVTKQPYSDDFRARIEVDVVGAIEFTRPRAECKDQDGNITQPKVDARFGQGSVDVQGATVVSLFMPGFDGLGAVDAGQRLKQDVPYLLVKDNAEQYYIVPVEVGAIDYINPNSGKKRAPELTTIPEDAERLRVERQLEKQYDEMDTEIFDFIDWLERTGMHQNSYENTLRVI